MMRGCPYERCAVQLEVEFAEGGEVFDALLENCQ